MLQSPASFVLLQGFAQLQ